MSHPDTIPIAGEFTRGVGKVVHFFNPKTGINVMKDLDGNFVSGWKLSTEQKGFLATLGTIGKKGKQ